MNIESKVGKKSLFADDYTLAGKLQYEKGISEFDKYLNGKSLDDINAVIHITKHPYGLVFIIAKLFSSCKFAVSFSEIKSVVLSEDNFEKSSLVFILVDNSRIVFTLKNTNIGEVENYFNEIEMTYNFIKLETDNVNYHIYEHNKHNIPALLSFFVPGLGQIVKQHFLKAFIVGFILFVGLFKYNVYAMVLIFIIWIWNIYDAYNSNSDF